MEVSIWNWVIIMEKEEFAHHEQNFNALFVHTVFKCCQQQTTLISSKNMKNLYKWKHHLLDWFENMVAKEKLPILSNFSFCHNVVKSHICSRGIKMRLSMGKGQEKLVTMRPTRDNPLSSLVNPFQRMANCSWWFWKHLGINIKFSMNECLIN